MIAASTVRRLLAVSLVTGVIGAIGISVELVSRGIRCISWLRTNPPHSTSLIMRRQLSTLGTIRDPGITWISLSSLSAETIAAIIAAEDINFVRHPGVDTRATWRALMRNIRERRRYGGSTITQQLAKNLFLNEERTRVRKLNEAAIAIILEASLSKERIFELYVNVVEWGPGVFGIESASYFYWGHSARHLSPTQATLLAAILASPLRITNRDLTQAPVDVQQRAALIGHRIGWPQVLRDAKCLSGN